jgi:peptidoglycan/xylan/chitin deacetylase (PgdA/CDA1 family)
LRLSYAEGILFGMRQPQSLQKYMKNISPPVFYYHSVAPVTFEGWVLKFLTIKLAVFENQLTWLKANNFKSIFLEEWLAIRTGQKTGTGREVCLTFDDGLLDNWVYAIPLAKKYGMRFTLFISPECICPQQVVRPTLEDVWNGNCREEDLMALGYLTWNELKIMQESGVADVQSHTMTHAKYINSPALRGFYYGGFKGMHPILNAHPEIRASYMHEPDFEKRLPWGAPLFEESSAVTVKKHTIHPAFMEEVLDLAGKHDLAIPAQRPAFEAEARQLHDSYRQSGQLLASLETEADYQARLAYEIAGSKSIIEEQLKKTVQFLCWPHGDNTAETHDLAKQAGYLATTSGKMIQEAAKPDRIPRIGANFTNSRPVSRLKFQYKIASHFKKQPWYSLWLANELRHTVLKNN